MIELYDGRPVNTSGRAKKETAVYDLLDSLGIEYKRTDHLYDGGVRRNRQIACACGHM